MVLANLSIYYTWKNIKSEYSNNKSKISAPRWSDTIGLPDGSYSIAGITGLLWIYHRKTQNFDRESTSSNLSKKTGYKLELLTPEIIRFIGSTKKDVDKDKNDENVPKLESFEVVLVHCNLVKNDYQHRSKVLFIYFPNKQFGQLINISPHSLTMMNTVNTKFSFAEIWCTDQARKALEIEDNVNLTLIIG